MNRVRVTWILSIYVRCKSSFSLKVSNDYESKNLKLAALNLNDSKNRKRLDENTLRRIAVCSIEWLNTLSSNMFKYGFSEKHLVDALCSYDDWSTLADAEKINKLCEIFRNASFKSSVYMNLISQNQGVIDLLTNKSKLDIRMKELRMFFKKSHLERLLIRSPGLITDNIDSIRYKFNYVFTQMGIEQEEMCRSDVYNHSMKHIRERHLFLTRAGFYVKHNKKKTKINDNPKLAKIVDWPLDEYLTSCTRNLLKKEDYRVFCEYLSMENFDDELLGNWIDKTLKKQIINSMSLKDHMAESDE
jgi:hypothetical protein